MKHHKPNPERALLQKEYKASIKDRIENITRIIDQEPNNAKAYFDRAKKVW